MSLLKKIKYFKWAKDAKDTIIGQNNELIWAENWKSVIQGLDWMQNAPSLAPGRWAVGYNYLYVMTRILHEIKPHSVLEFGRGISTTLISQYFSNSSITTGEHWIIEHDDEWIDFYLKSRNLSQYSKVFNVPLNVETQNKKERHSYQGLDSVIADKKFSVISIDGPFGSEEDSRTDILPFLPQILEDQFVIIMDDTQRTGEKQTLAKIMDILDKSGAKVFTGNYSSLKNCTVITSEKYRWICTM